MENIKMKQLLEELEATQKTYAYGSNHLLDTIIARVKELLENKDEYHLADTEIRIGY